MSGKTTNNIVTGGAIIFALAAVVLIARFSMPQPTPSVPTPPVSNTILVAPTAAPTPIPTVAPTVAPTVTPKPRTRIMYPAVSPTIAPSISK